MAILKREINKLLELGVLVPSNSEYASPVHLVPKKDGDYRITGDFRLLNKQTKVDRHPIPFLTNFVDAMAGSTVFSSLDLYKSYYQLELAPSSVHKTAMCTPIGLFAYKRLAMGMRNSQACMTKFMNEVLRGLDFVFCYIDDLLIYSRDMEEHLWHLTLVFERLKYYGLILNRKKCVFAVPEITFLGHRVCKNGVAPLEDKVTAIREFPKPKTMKDMRRFLGMVNFYRRFIPDAAQTLASLNSLLSPHKNSRKDIEWNDAAVASFNAIKQKLADATMLAYPVLNAATQLVTDASDTSVGAVIQQTVNDITRPIAFFSRNLTTAQKKWSTFDRELLAIFLAVKHFKYFLEGRPFTILTDHKPLSFMGASSMNNATARQTRHMNYISNFTSDIRYIKGDQNIAADCLSRPAQLQVNIISEEQSPLDYQELAEAQELDPSIALLQQSTNSMQVSAQKLPDSNRTILVDTSTGTARPFVPVAFRRKVFDLLHGLAHPGVKASQKLISRIFVWSKIHIDIRDWTKACIQCQRAKVQRHNVAPLQRFSTSDERFAHVHLDLVGPLPASEGYTYLLTAICRVTRHFEAIPLRDITAKSCADNFMLHWVARFGAPSTITTDRGRQFTSTLWHELAEFLGAKLLHTTSYHPACNGLVERAHRTLKAALKTHENPTNWFSNLGFVLLGLRAVVKEDLGFSTSEITIGKTLRVPGQFVSGEHEHTHSSSDYRQQLTRYISSLRSTEPRHPSSRKTYLDKALNDCTHVFIRNPTNKPPLSPSYDGPFRVLSKHDKYYTVDLVTRVDNVSIDRVKAAHLLRPGHEEAQTFHSQHPAPLTSATPFPINIPSPPSSPKTTRRDEQPAEVVINRFGRRIVRPRRFQDA